MKKKNLFLTGILALALVFTLAFTGCDPDDGYVFPEDAEKLLGTWFETDGTATDNKTFVQVLGNGNFSFKYDNVGDANAPGQGKLTYSVIEAEWYAVNNAGATAEAYPTGYKITGKLDTVAFTPGAAYTDAGNASWYSYFRTIILAPLVASGDPLYHADEAADNPNKDKAAIVLKEKDDEVTIYVYFNAAGTEMIIGTEAGGNVVTKYKK